MDNQTTLTQLKEWANEFVEERNWYQYHTPKNLAMSIAIEAAELMEIFQWKTAEESLIIGQDAQTLEHIGEELSDILAYLLNMANSLEIDLSSSFQKKMLKNRQKYPIDAETKF